MYRVIVSQIHPEVAQDSVELLAQFVVDGTGIRAEAGDRVDVIRTIPVVDLETGERLTSDDDPVRWARFLPQAFRSGDVSAQVEQVPDESEAQLRPADLAAALADTLAARSMRAH